MAFFRDQGVGVGLRKPHFAHFLKTKPAAVSWAEVISENFMDWAEHRARAKLQDLLQIRRNIPIALHGVSLSIGSADPLNENYLKRLKELASRMEPLWISDHLCWTGVDGVNLHDLMPLPYTEEAIAWVSERISKVQDYLGRRILIENVSSYLEYESSRLTEWDFLAAVAKRADCGILLDINNIYVSSINHGFDPLQYLRAIPPSRVGQLHLAGHAKRGDHCIDTHDAPVCAEVWDLYAKALKILQPTSVMIERDANIPEWEELEQELLRAANIRKEAYADTGKAAATI